MQNLDSKRLFYPKIYYNVEFIWVLLCKVSHPAKKRPHIFHRYHPFIVQWLQSWLKLFSSTQVRLLERRLGEVAWTPTEQSERADEFQQTLFEKEKVIKNLEGEVESQVRIFQRMKNILVSIFCFTKLLYVLNRSFRLFINYRYSVILPMQWSPDIIVKSNIWREYFPVKSWEMQSQTESKS